MGRNIFFTSDLHLCHQNILKYTEYKFNDITARNQLIIYNWNSVVKNTDVVYILGDFMWRTEKAKFDKLKQFSNRLNGQKILIRGNHDRYSNYQYTNAGFKQVHDLLSVNLRGDYYVLCHYAMRFWERSHYGSYCLHGHEHFKRQINFQLYKAMEMSTRIFNVCMDGNNFFPYQLSDIYREIGGNPINFIER